MTSFVTYQGAFNPLATFRRLRDAGVLGAHAYLHVAPDRADIGWAPIAELRALDGHGDDGWRLRLQALADLAAAEDRVAFGHVGFDAIDSDVGVLPDHSGTGRPLVRFVVPGEVLTFLPDRVEHRSHAGADVGALLASQPDALAPRPPRLARLSPVTERAPALFTSAVRRATAAITAGELEKVVLSRYQAYDAPYDPVALFAAYCRAESSVDAFLVQFEDQVSVIASPELLLRAEGGTVVTNPLAGTRARGATAEDDDRLRRELRADHKELAEHVLSVTTMIEELEPLCEPGSLAVRHLLEVQRQKKVQHLSSILNARLAPERRALDALWALFPSVTVTGLPKTAAAPLLRRLELHPRALYGGAFGWVRGRTDCRFSLAIRGIFRYGGRSFLHAGAGIMGESVPEAELMETAQKLHAMEDALAHAAGAHVWADPVLV